MFHLIITQVLWKPSTFFHARPEPLPQRRCSIPFTLVTRPMAKGSYNGARHWRFQQITFSRKRMQRQANSFWMSLNLSTQVLHYHFLGWTPYNYPNANSRNCSLRWCFVAKHLRRTLAPCYANLIHNSTQHITHYGAGNDTHTIRCCHAYYNSIIPTCGTFRNFVRLMYGKSTFNLNQAHICWCYI